MTNHLSTHHRTLLGLAAVLVVVLGTATSAQAGPRRDLIRQHACVRMSAAAPTPTAGYLVRDVAHPERGLFYVSSGDLTSGLLVGWGGTWQLRYQCRR